MAADGQYTRVNGSEKEADDEAPLIAQPVRPVGFRQEAKEDFKNVRLHQARRYPAPQSRSARPANAPRPRPAFSRHAPRV